MVFPLQVDFSQISQASSTTKPPKRNIVTENSEYKSNGLKRNDQIPDLKGKTNETEFTQSFHGMSICDSPPSNLPIYPQSPSCQIHPPPIIHSTFSPPQGATYLPLEQGAVHGGFVPCIPTSQPMQPNIHQGSQFYIQQNSNAPYNFTETSVTLCYPSPSFIPTLISSTPVITTPEVTPFVQRPSSDSSSYKDATNVCTNKDSHNVSRPSDPVRCSESTQTAMPPDDNPGLPLQDEVCPFHQHMSYWAEQLRKNRKMEMAKNEERFCFLKWVDGAFSNITVIPPGTGKWHQLNLEYLARIVTCQDGLLFPDSLVGTDSHTTMVNGLGVLGWTVGTLDAEAVMFGHPLSLPVIPRVVGVCLHGTLKQYATSTGIGLYKDNFRQ